MVGYRIVERVRDGGRLKGQQMVIEEMDEGGRDASRRDG